VEPYLSAQDDFAHFHAILDMEIIPVRILLLHCYNQGDKKPPQKAFTPPEYLVEGIEIRETLDIS
jgi:hypothetical protein